MKVYPLVCVLALLLIPALSRATEDRLVVHEWGTFTSLQDDDGRTIGGINSDDEPVPPFCHSLRWDLILGNPSQGVPRSHPDVTMRLETPVMYFHPAAGSGPITLDVSAEFRGGWLSQYFPYGKVTAPGYNGSGKSPGRITDTTVGTLKWTGVRVGGSAVALPETNDHVWTTPRNVDASTVTVVGEQKREESEKYLFYRGVGHLDAPLMATVKDRQLRLATRSLFVNASGYQFVPRAWVADFQPDGTCRAVAIDRFGGPRPAEVVLPGASAHPGPAPLDLPALRADMKRQLVKQGLFEDEAEAMLATWELSYFKSPGLRVFYMVPHEWVRATLPLNFSADVICTRVMVGRLELIAPWQREIVRKIASAPTATTRPRAADPIIQAYGMLGRFRNALVLDELSRHPTASLRAFIMANDLGPFSGPGVK